MNSAKKIFPDGPTIRWCRFEKGWTQDQLAQRAAINKKSVENLEDGRAVRPSTIRKVAEALEVDINRLLSSPPSSFPNSHQTNELIERIIRLEKKHEALQLYLKAEDSLRHELPEEAEYYYREVIILLRAIPESDLLQSAQIGIAKVERRRVDLQAAINTLRHILESHPHNARAHYNLACYLNLSGAPKNEVFEQLAEALRCSSECYGQYAGRDNDLRNLWVDPTFKRIINVQSDKGKEEGTRASST